MNAQVETVLESSVDISLAEQALKLAKMRQRWAACRDIFAPVVSAFQRIGIEPTFQGDDYVTVMATGDKSRLEQAFRILRGAGFTFRADRPKKGDSQWYAFFAHPDSETKIFFQFTSSVCKRVKVGTKMVEQDVFETQCGDITVDAPEALSAPPALHLVTADDVPF
jgi:hypothetical protein